MNTTAPVTATVSTQPDKPLAGWRVLVPRGGSWGDGVSASLRTRGAVPVVAPLINFAPAADQPRLLDALARLEAGEFDWVTISSSTAIDVLYAHQVKIPETTRVAAVGEATSAALRSAGYQVALVPTRDNFAIAMAEDLIAAESAPRRILVLRNASAKPVVSTALLAAGHDVTIVDAYRVVGEPASERIMRDVLSGKINAILVTSGAVAMQVHQQFADRPAHTVIAALGARTAQAAREIGLDVDVISDRATVEALVSAVAQYPLPHAVDEFQVV